MMLAIFTIIFVMTEANGGRKKLKFSSLQEWFRITDK